MLRDLFVKMSISQCVQMLVIAQMQFPQNLASTFSALPTPVTKSSPRFLSAFTYRLVLEERCVSLRFSIPLSSECVCGLFVCERRMTCLLVEGSSCALDLVCVAPPCPVIASRLLASASQRWRVVPRPQSFHRVIWRSGSWPRLAVPTGTAHSCAREHNRPTHRHAARPESRANPKYRNGNAKIAGKKKISSLKHCLVFTPNVTYWVT